MAPELLKIKIPQELYRSVPPFPQPLGLKRTRASRSGNCRGVHTPTCTENSRTVVSTEYMPDVPLDILQLSANFPFPGAVDICMRKSIREALPPRVEAQRICEEARSNALWQ